MKFILIARQKLHMIFYLSMVVLLLTSIVLILLDYKLLLAYSLENSEPVITQEVREDFNTLYTNSEKRAYLTFDDGPSAKVTTKVLDILDKLEVKANFFLIGKQVEQYPSIVLRQYHSGHFLANHSYSHNKEKLYRSQNDFITEILKTDEAISKAIGVENYHCHLFRFPNGYMSNAYHAQKVNCAKYLEQIDYLYVDWNVLNNDSMQKYTPSQLLNNLKKSCKDKNSIIVLMHDTGDVNNTYDVLEDSISYLKEQGYTFHTFYELLPSFSSSL